MPMLSPEMLENPYPLYAMLRAGNPVFRVPSPEPEGAGQFILTRHEDVQQTLRDARFSVDRGRSDFFIRNRDRLPPSIVAALLGEQGGLRSMLVLDPPDHTRIRGLVSKAFTPRQVTRLRERIAELVRELLDAVAAEGEMDVMTALAAPLPAIVIADLLGVPREDYAIFKAWATDIVSLVGNPEPLGALARADGAMQALLAYLGEIIAKRRREPRDDLISAMIAAQEAHDTLTDAELLATCNLLLLAGHETTTNLIGNGLYACLRHPEEMARLERDPTLLKSAIDEMLRFDSPVQATFRIPTEDVALGGQLLPKGALVIAAIGAANRDPAVFSEPDRFDVARGDNRHLSFGFGAHFCLGAPLARLEGELVFSALVARFAKFELATETIRYRPNMILRGLTSLPVRFSSR
jgi:cytochrome P450